MDLVYSNLNDKHLDHLGRIFDRLCGLHRFDFKKLSEDLYHYSHFSRGSLAKDEYDIDAPKTTCQTSIDLHLDRKEKRATLSGDLNCALFLPMRIEGSLEKYGSFKKQPVNS